jgi:hypothetical protein
MLLSWTSHGLQKKLTSSRLGSVALMPMIWMATGAGGRTGTAGWPALTGSFGAPGTSLAWACFCPDDWMYLSLLCGKRHDKVMTR